MDNLLEKLNAIFERYMYVEESLGNPDIVGDMDKFKKFNKEYKDLQPLVTAYHDYKNLLGNIATAKEALSDEDADMREMAREELNALEPNLAPMEEHIKLLLVPKDPEDEKDVVFEIRSGTGGDEASLFAGDLYRMYQRFFDKQGWKTDIVFVNDGTVGGYNKIVLEISGQEVYGRLKFESGAHRVQRVPDTETKGRVHTSAVTVAVIPKFEEEEINIRKEELKIDVFRASGAGGQHVNRTESAVRITHLPTGLVQECQDGRSQIQNREIAMQRLYQKIVEMQREQIQNEQAAQRRSLVGSGDRSEKIRTYNYPQNRITDHRINFTTHNLDKFMEGEIDDMLTALITQDNADKLAVAED
jgi:peptide chain release factor 1